MKNKIKGSLLVLSIMLLQACAPKSYVVEAPVPSTIAYQNIDSLPSDLSFTDNRPEDSKVFSYGVLNAELVMDGAAIDPIEYLKTHTAKELSARGLATNVVEGGGVVVDVNKLEIRNHRTNGYTPFISFTMISADVMVNGQSERIAAYIKRGKIPVWSFDEVVQPALNEPLDLLIKEFSAKLSKKLYDTKISDGEVGLLIDRVNSDLKSPTAYIDVYTLGFGNNDSAIPALIDYTKDNPEYIRLAAISSLGILKAEGQIDLLKDIYENAGSWADRAMAIKALGDIGTQDALSFLTKVYAGLEGKKKKEKLWTREIIDLYL